MIENNYNTSYRIALYQLPPEYKDLLNAYFSEHYSKNTFEFVTMDELKTSSSNIMDQPDILLIDINQEIDDEFRQFCSTNLIQAIRITDQSIQSVFHDNELLISVNQGLMEKKSLTDSDSTSTTIFHYCAEFLSQQAQLANTSKLQYVSKNLLQQEKQVLPDNQKEVLDVLMRLNHFIKLKDEYTMMHSDHVSDYAVLLGKKLNLSDDDLHLLRIGGELHDIGKVGIPDAILRKGSSLTDQEFAIMKKHTVIGDAILPNQGYEQIKAMIRSHHEKMDGTGYPDGLKGEEIPYFARILSVCDTFDAMTTQRSYNRMKTLEEAFEELRNASKLQPNRFQELRQQLDPELVECFIQAVKEDASLMQEFRNRDIEIMNYRMEQQATQNSTERRL